MRQRTFSLVPQRIGSLASLATPVPSGPRHAGQLPQAINGAKAKRNMTENFMMGEWDSVLAQGNAEFLTQRLGAAPPQPNAFSPQIQGGTQIKNRIGAALARGRVCR